MPEREGMGPAVVELGGGESRLARGAGRVDAHSLLWL
jgi:hypothetical protein